MGSAVPQARGSDGKMAQVIDLSIDRIEGRSPQGTSTSLVAAHDSARQALQLCEEQRAENFDAVLDAAARQFKFLKVGAQRPGAGWFGAFMQNAREAIDSKLRYLWASILVEELRRPGSIHRDTLGVLSRFEGDDLQLLENLCATVIQKPEPFPAIFEFNAAPYLELGVSYDALQHLHDLGVVRLSSTSKDQVPFQGERYKVAFGTRLITISYPEKGGNSFVLGHVQFTRAGAELFSVIESEPDYALLNYWLEWWNRHGLRTEVFESEFPQDSPSDRHWDEQLAASREELATLAEEARSAGDSARQFVFREGDPT